MGWRSAVNPWKKNLLTVFRAFLGVGLLYYVLSVTGDWSAAYRFLSESWLLPGLTILTLLGAAIESQRLKLLLKSQGIALSFAHGYWVVTIGAFFNFCIPGGTGGDVMKLYHLASENRQQVVEVATVLLVDRAIALFSLLLLVVALAIFNAQLVQEYVLIQFLIAIAVGGLVGLLLLAALSCSTQFRASRLYRFVVTRMPLHKYLERVSDALYTFRDHKAALLGAALLSMSGHVALAVMLIAVASVFMPLAPPLAVCLLSFLGLLANALPITPGGLGIGEAAFEGLFGVAGFAGGATLILAWRLAMLPLCIVGGVLYVAGTQGRLLTSATTEDPVRAFLSPKCGDKDSMPVATPARAGKYE
jgi:glycosyltransferase 2 family protein